MLPYSEGRNAGAASLSHLREQPQLHLLPLPGIRQKADESPFPGLPGLPSFPPPQRRNPRIHQKKAVPGVIIDDRGTAFSYHYRLFFHADSLSLYA